MFKAVAPKPLRFLKPTGLPIARARWQRGFTLLELMVVIVIIAILAGFVTVNIDIRNTPKAIRETAQRLALQMQLASDQSVYSRAQLGVRFHPESYEFYFLNKGEDGEGSWEILDDNKLNFRDVGEELEFQVEISGLPIILETLSEERASLAEDEVIKPHILFLSNGEIMPDFSIEVADSDQRYRHQVFTGIEEPVRVEQVE